jgi:hypothetical protein
MEESGYILSNLIVTLIQFIISASIYNPFIVKLVIVAMLV